MISLYIYGIDPETTTKSYLYNFFIKLGNVYKINYQNKNTAHVHMHSWHPKNSKIQKISEEIEDGKMVRLVHQTLHYWNISLYQPNIKSKQITMHDLFVFTEQYNNNNNNKIVSV